MTIALLAPRLLDGKSKEPQSNQIVLVEGNRILAVGPAKQVQIPADAKIIPGHGKLATVDVLRDYHAMLIETVGLVRKGMAEGKTLEQLRAAGLPDKWQSFGTGWINTNRWIETIYNQSHKDPAAK